MKFTHTLANETEKPTKTFLDLPCNQIFYIWSEPIGFGGPYIKINQNSHYNTIALDSGKIFSWPSSLIYSYYFPQEVKCINLTEFK